MANTNLDTMRIYDFNVLKKSMKIKDASGIDEYEIPVGKLPRVKNQKDYSCCVACALAEVLEFFNQIETGEFKELSVSYIYGRHRSRESTARGMIVEEAIKYLSEYGSVPVEFFPKLMEMPEVKKQLEGRDDLDVIAIPYRIQGYCKIGWQNPETQFENLKLALVNYETPIVAWTNKGFSENHCFIIYGFETKDGVPYVKFQNSYGETYGNGGRAAMALSNMKAMYLLFDEQVRLPFEDVPEDAWFYKNIFHMYAAGFVSGKSEREFFPNDPLTRAEGCAILDRVLARLDGNNTSQFVSLENRLQRIEERLNIF